MARYIDADALYQKLYPLDIADKRKYTINAKAVADAIVNIPTADVVPKSKYDILKSLITHKEEEAYKKGYNDALKDVEEMIKNISEREK